MVWCILLNLHQALLSRTFMYMKLPEPYHYDSQIWCLCLSGVIQKKCWPCKDPFPDSNKSGWHHICRGKKNGIERKNIGLIFQSWWLHDHLVSDLWIFIITPICLVLLIWTQAFIWQFASLKFFFQSTWWSAYSNCYQSLCCLILSLMEKIFSHY